MKRNVKGTLTMDREGEFKVEVLGDTHCGIQNPLTIKYHVRVECSVRLDDRGFLFDQLTVDQFFKKHKSTKLSCEKFAMSCARRLWKVIHEENPSCEIREMMVSLSPAPHLAKMTFRYREG
jgi:hypothetical protein